MKFDRKGEGLEYSRISQVNGHKDAIDTLNNTLVSYNEI